MKKKVIIISSVAMLCILAVMMFCFRPRYAMQEDFEKKILVENGESNENVLVYEFTIDEAGEYIFHARWKTEPSGVLTGFSITDEAGAYLYHFTADGITLDSAEPLELAAGTYTLTLEFITSAQEWQGFFEKDGNEVFLASDFDDYEFAKDGKFTISYSFSMEEYNNNWSISVILGTLLGIVLVTFLAAFSQKDETMKQQYDERQELVRGRGFKYAFFAMLIWNALFYILKTADIHALYAISMEFVCIVGIMLGTGIYAVYCIWNDAYFALNQTAVPLMVMLSVFGIINLVFGIRYVMYNPIFQEGTFDIRVTNLLAGMLTLVIFAVMLIKKLRTDREDA